MSDLPPGFVLDAKPADTGLPAGFVLDAAPAIATSKIIPAPTDFTTKADDPAMRAPMTNDTSLMAYLGGVTDQVGRGLAEGAIDLVGLPNTLSTLGRNVTDWGLQKAGVSPEYAAPISRIANPLAEITPEADVLKGYVDSLNSATADTLGVERPRTEPENIAERYAHRTSEVLGGALLPVGGSIVAAEKLGLQGAKELSPIARSFIEPAAVNPAKFASKELSVATGAGLGSSTANEMVDPSTTMGQIADLFGGLVGGGAVGLTRVVGGAAKNIFDAIRSNPNYADDVVKQAVVDRLAKAANVPGSDQIGVPLDVRDLVAAIENPTSAARPSKVIPGYSETLADTTANPGLASLEYGRQQGQNSGMFTQRRMANNEAVDAAMTNIAPKETPGAFRDALALERDRRLMDAETMRLNSEDEVARALGIVTPTTTPAQRGNTVRTVLEEARDAARQRTEDAYGAVETDRMVDPAVLTQSLDEAAGDLTQAERALVPQGLIDRVSTLGRPTLDDAGNEVAPAPVSMREATTLRSELARLRAAALGDPKAEKGGRNAARVIAQMQTRVDDFIAGNLTDEENLALQAAKDTKFDEAERFTRQGDPVAEVLQRYEGGQPKVRDDNVAGKFVNDQALGRLLTQADTPTTRSAIREELLSRADMSRPDRIDEFMQQYGQQIDRFPGLRQDLGRAMQTRQNAMSATETQNNLVRDLGTENQPGRSPVGKYLNYSDATSERAMSEVLANKDPAKAADELMEFVGNEPKAVEGARAAFWQKLKSESQSTDNTQRSMSGNRAWRGDWLKGWLDKPETQAVADRLYRDKPEDLAALRLYADVLDNTDLRVRGKAAATSGTTQGMANNIMTPETLQSRAYAYMRGQVSGTYLATSIAAVVARRAVRGARTDAIERMTDKALLDPEFAKLLLKENNPANRAAIARKTKGWAASEAATFIDAMNEDDSEDGEIKKAIAK